MSRRRDARSRPDHAGPVAGVVRAVCAATLAAAAGAAVPRTAPAQAADTAPAVPDALAGAVVDAESGRPLAGAEVTVTRAGDAGRAAPVAVRRADDGGRWQVRALEPGEYRVRVRHVGYAAADRPWRVTGDAAAPPLRLALTPVARSLEALVVTANRRIQKLKDSPAAVQLVDRAEIERAGAADVATVLTEQAGLAVDGDPTGGSGVMLQGLDSRRVLVLVDGQPMNGRINGTLDLSRLPAAAVSRVEIVKGPQSTLYGSDAMGGVVNVITRDLTEPAWGGSLGVRSGSQGRLDLNAGLLGTSGPAAWSLDLGRRASRTTPGRDSEIGTATGRWDGTAKARWRVDSSLAVEASTTVVGEDQRWRSGPIWFFTDRTQAIGRLTGTWTRGSTRVQPIVHYTQFGHLFRRSLTDRPASRDGEEDTQRLLVAELLGSHAFGERLVLDAGAQARREGTVSDRVRGDDAALGASRTRSSVEPYAQLTATAGRWTFVPGMRLTADRQWGTHWTPRVATLVRPTPALALRAAAGRGFRAPDFKELSLWFPHVTSDFSYIVRGNPALRPELSDNLSASAEWAGARVYLRADAFHNRFRDFIESSVIGDTALAGAPGLATYYTYANVGRGVTRGVDLEAALRVRGLRAEAGYGLLDAYESTTGAPLLGRPRHSARVTLSTATRAGLSASLGGVYTGRTPVTRDAAGAALDRSGYLRLNARLAQTLRHRLGGAWRVEAGAQNLLDQRPQLWPGFTGRQVYAGLNWTR